MSSSSLYEKEVSEWSVSELSNWLESNNYNKISEICKKNSICGYDLFSLSENILKDEFKIFHFHDRQTFLRTIQDLIYEQLTNSETNESVTISLENDHKMRLGDLSNYIASIFHLDQRDIIYRDTFGEEIISPLNKIVILMILYPFKFKNIIISSVYTEMNNPSNESQDKKYGYSSYNSDNKDTLSNNEKQMEPPLYNHMQKQNLLKDSQMTDNIMSSINNIKKSGGIKTKGQNLYSTMDHEINYNIRNTDIDYNNTNTNNTNTNSNNNNNNHYDQNNYINQRTGNTNIKQQNQNKNIKYPNNNQPSSISSNMRQYQSFQTNIITKINQPNNINRNITRNNNEKILYNNASTEGSAKNDIITNKELNTAIVGDNNIDYGNNIPIDVKYKSEKRIYRQHEKKRQENFDSQNDFSSSNNKLIISKDASGDEMKFKPSYPAQKYNSIISQVPEEKTGQNKYNTRQYQYPVKEQNTKSVKQPIRPKRVFNEDFLDNYEFNE